MTTMSIPYGLADHATGFATVSIDEVIAAAAVTTMSIPCGLADHAAGFATVSMDEVMAAMQP